MKLIAAFACLISSAVVVAAEPVCGPDYPRDLPCLSGGDYVPVPARDLPVPNVKMVLLVYETPAAALYDEFTSRARDAGWVVAEREVANEPDGVRYRTSMRKGAVSVGVSAYTLQGRPVLQLSVFAQ
jgi:hypothetical protein